MEEASLHPLSSLSLAVKLCLGEYSQDFWVGVGLLAAEILDVIPEVCVFILPIHSRGPVVQAVVVRYPVAIRRLVNAVEPGEDPLESLSPRPVVAHCGSVVRWPGATLVLGVLGPPLILRIYRGAQEADIGLVGFVLGRIVERGRQVGHWYAVDLAQGAEVGGVLHGRVLHSANISLCNNRDNANRDGKVRTGVWLLLVVECSGPTSTSAADHRGAQPVGH